MHDDDQISERIATLAASACIELFAAYEVTLGPSAKSWGSSEDRLLCGVVGFVGRRLRGTALLAGARAPIDASCPDGGRLRDWVGELANQLAGRLKTKFLARGVEVALTTPIVLSGVRLEPLPRGSLEPTVFSCPQGEIMVWAEVETGDDFKFGSERPSTHGGEGDVFLF